jgi:hypothetical protein
MLEEPARDKHSSLLRKLVNYRRKSFIRLTQKTTTRVESGKGYFSSQTRADVCGSAKRTRLRHSRTYYQLKKFYSLADENHSNVTPIIIFLTK